MSGWLLDANVLLGCGWKSHAEHAALLPVLTSYKDATDAHLVTLARRRGLKLATLDGALIAKPWAAGVAENPLPQAVQS